MASAGRESAEELLVWQYRRIWLAFFILGTINNLAYVVVGAAAKSLADGFNASDLIGAIQWANVFMGIFIKGINTWALANTSYRSRIAGTTLFMLSGLLGVALSVYISFSFAIFAIVLIGCASAFGESIVLVYLKRFPAELTGAWASGTGMAGVGGTLIYLGFQGGNFSNETVFLSLLPTAAVYYLTFLYVERQQMQVHQLSPPLRPDVSGDDDGDALDGVHAVKRRRGVDVTSPTATSSLGSEDGTPLLPAATDDSADPLQLQMPAEPRPPNVWKNTVRITRIVLGLATQLAMVYFFEYVAGVGFAAVANPKYGRKDLPWVEDHAYEILAFCYQFGVLISRSSISFIRIQRVEILTVLQGANFVLWLFHALHPFMPLWVQFTAMVYVGLLGGAMYVNVFYLLVREESPLTVEDKDMGINITSIFVNLGIVVSSVFEIVAAKTFLAQQVRDSK